MKVKNSGYWIGKLGKPFVHEVKLGPENWNKKYGGEKMLISTPYHIMQVVNEIPKGRLLSVGMLRQKLAKNAGADYCCPLSPLSIFKNFSIK